MIAGLRIQNIFSGKAGSIDGLKCHTVEFYYAILFDDVDKTSDTTDDGEKLVWIPVSDLKNYNMKPKFFSQRIEEILDSKKIIHIINKEDI